MLVDQPGEHRVAGVLRNPQPVRERQIAEIEVAAPPAELRRIDGEHDGLAASGLGASHEAVDRSSTELP